RASSSARAPSARRRSSHGAPRASSQLLTPHHEAGGDRELVPGQTERLARHRLVHALHLVEDAARQDLRAPALDRALTGTHSGLERLLREGLIGEDADVELASALRVALDRHTSGLDLTRGDVAALRR